MKRTKQLLFFVALFSLVSCEDASKTTDTIAEGEDYLAVEDSECLAHADWFTQVDGRRKTPAPNEGPTSPFANNDSVTNCNFHQWSWQKFLWLTNEDANGTPLFINDLHQITSHGQLIDNSNGIVLTSTAQASGAADILQTPGDSPSTIYYAIFTDDSLYQNILKYAPIAKNDPLAVQYKTFPVGAMEVKTSWVDINALSDTSSYFITDGIINETTTRVALLGLHVIAVVENHPEFVWATFEHQELAPAYDWDAATPTTDAQVTSTTDYPLFAANANATVNNISSQTTSHTNIFSVYKYGVPVRKVNPDNEQIYLKASQDGAENVNHIDQINASVKNQLSGVWNNYFYNGSLWIDTEGYADNLAQAKLLDSLSYKLPQSDTSDLTRGSVAMYNLTMETYVQVGFNPTSIHADTIAKNITNCFSCHNASANKNNLSPLYISHLFTGYLGDLNGLSKKSIKQQHVDEIREQFLMRAAKK